MVLNLGGVGNTLFNTSKNLQEGFSQSIQNIQAPSVFLGNAKSVGGSQIGSGATRYFGFGIEAHSTTAQEFFNTLPRDGILKNFRIEVSLGNTMDGDTVFTLLSAGTTAATITFGAGETGVKTSKEEFQASEDDSIYIRVVTTASTSGNLNGVYAGVEFY